MCFEGGYEVDFYLEKKLFCKYGCLMVIIVIYVGF